MLSSKNLSYRPIRLRSPLRVHFEITSECNCNCKHCYQGNSFIKPSQLSTNNIYKILTDLSESGVFCISYTGGEPFLRKDFIDILKETNRRGFHISLSTNGSLINEQTASILSDLNVEVQVSLDSWNDEEHDWFRGFPGLAFKAKNAIKFLTKAKVKTKICSIIGNFNYKSAFTFPDHAAELGVVSISFIDIMPIGNGKLIYEQLSLTLQQKQQLYKYFQINYQNSNISVALNNRFKFLINQDLLENICSAGITGCTISPDGFLRPCPFHSGVNSENLIDKSIKKIWLKNPEFIKFRNGWFIEQCGACEFWLSKCAGGCRVLALDRGNKFNEIDPTCPIIS